MSLHRKLLFAIDIKVSAQKFCVEFACLFESISHQLQLRDLSFVFISHNILICMYLTIIIVIININ